MTLAALPPETLRDQIMLSLGARFRDAEVGVNGAQMKWDWVYDDTPPKLCDRIGNTVAFIDGRELKSMETGRTRCTLSFTLEFTLQIAMGDKPTSAGRRVLGEIERLMLSDIYSGGLSLNIVEVGNELSIECDTDTTVSGVVFWEVQYRHAVHNPTVRI